MPRLAGALLIRCKKMMPTAAAGTYRQPYFLECRPDYARCVTVAPFRARRAAATPSKMGGALMPLSMARTLPPTATRVAIDARSAY